jgi:uroporphyrinogen-III synthase
MTTVDRAALDGFCIGVTADRRWEEQAELLRRRGASILHGPTIKTLPLGSGEGLREATESLIARPPDYLVANTGIGIRSWFGAAESWGRDPELLHALSATKVFARGPKASGAVYSMGLEVFCRAPSERLREVVELVLAQEPSLVGRRVAVQRDGQPSGSEMQALVEAGAEVVEIPVYEWKLPDDLRPAVRLAESVISGKVHAVTFTSGPSLRNWMEIAEEHDLRQALLHALNREPMVVACVGPVCAEVAHAEGIDEVVVPMTSRLGPLVLCLTDALASRALAVEVGSSTLALQGTVARIGDERIDFTDTEARVLGLIAARRGGVVTKADLLRQVWGDPNGDPHVVEVTVARVRRRLGSFSSAIQSVPRRGYRLAVA